MQATTATAATAAAAAARRCRLAVVFTMTVRLFVAARTCNMDGCGAGNGCACTRRAVAAAIRGTWQL